MRIELEPHISWARRLVGRLAHDIGFARESLDEIEVCVKELASNMLAQSTQGGILKAEVISQDNGAGIEISVDSNGSSRASQQGYDAFVRCMATVECLADEFHVYSSRSQSQVVLRKYLPAGHTHSHSDSDGFRVGVEVRNHPSSTVCGDGYVVTREGALTLLAVIDGLGHGEDARHAASIAEQFLLETFPRKLDDVPLKLHSILAGTRGVSVGLVLIDEPGKVLHFVGVGDISVRLKSEPRGKWMRPVCVPGAVGQILPAVDVMDYPWNRESILVIHTDGIKRGWELSSPQLDCPSADIARSIMDSHWCGRDDATVMVVK